MKNKVRSLLVLFLVWVIATTVWADEKGAAVRLNRVKVKDSYKPRVLGLFIGIGTYQDPFWNDLEYPVADVNDMVAFFTDNTSLSLDYAMVLTSPEDTTRDKILNDKLDTFQMKNASEKDVVIVYISSHGSLTKELVTVIENGEKKIEARKVPYILTSDSKQGNVADSAIALYKFILWFEKLRSQRKLLILDMCHSGQEGKSQLSPDQAEMIASAKGIHYTPMEDSKASIILSACPMGGTSYEDKQLKNSVYTYYLLEGMKHGDLNGDHAVTISEAHNYAIDKTQSYTWEQKKYKQIPTTYSKILGKDPIIVNGSPSEPGKPTIFSYASANQGVALFVDDAYKGMLPKGIAVDPGGHRIECKHNGKTIYAEKIEIIQGSDYMLPCFTVIEKKSEQNTWFMVEGGYRGFIRGDVSQDLTPESPVAGFSIRSFGIKADWLTLSGGMDVAWTEDLIQYGGHIGVGLTTEISGLRFSMGPDFMVLFFSYGKNTLAGETPEKEMTFFCPGAEIFLGYAFKNDLVIGAGARGHYLPYKYEGTTNSVFSNQAFIGGGFLF